MPEGFSQDILSRIVNVKWGSDIYMVVESFLTGTTVKTTDGKLLDEDLFPESGNAVRLYSIPSGKNVLSFDAPGSQEHFGAVLCFVYSTARESITRLSQVFYFQVDADNTLWPDSWRDVFIYDANAGNYNVSIHQDMASEQIDNYGEKFHPWKVTFEPTSISEDHIPHQPPPSLVPPPPATRRS